MHTKTYRQIPICRAEQRWMLVWSWCKFGAKIYRTIRKLYHDMRLKRQKIKQKWTFSTIFRGINASEKPRRDNQTKRVDKLACQRASADCSAVARKMRAKCVAPSGNACTARSIISLVWSTSKNALLMQGIFHYLFENNELPLRASEVYFVSEVIFDSKVSPIGEVANLTSLVRSTNFTVLRTTSLSP